MLKLIQGIKVVLLTELKLLQSYGITKIGYRYFLKDGRSFGIPTGNSLNEINRDQSFYKIMDDFLSQELLDLQRKNNSYVSRSMDHQYSEYMEYLKTMDIPNSLGVYRFSQGRIDSVFFIYEEYLGETRDRIMNNLNIIEKHASKIISNIEGLGKLIEYNDNYEFVLNDCIRRYLFNNIKSNTSNIGLRIYHDNKEVLLTKKEVEVLNTFMYSTSNNSIASKLGISTSTVEKHLYNMRSKLNIFTRDGLLELSHSLSKFNNIKR